MRRPNEQWITELAPKLLKRNADSGLMCTEKDCGTADASGIIHGQKNPDQIEIQLRANNCSPTTLFHRELMLESTPSSAILQGATR